MPENQNTPEQLTLAIGSRFKEPLIPFLCWIEESTMFLKIKFDDLVTGIDFFSNFHIIQRALESRVFEQKKYIKISLDFVDTVWFDSLSMCNLLMTLEKFKSEYTEKNENIVSIRIVEEGEESISLEKRRFISFLDDNGFMQTMLDRFEVQPKDPYLLAKDTFSEVHKCIYPFTIIKFGTLSESQIQDVIVEQVDLIRKAVINAQKPIVEKQELDTILTKVSYFLQEALDNIAQHAYVEHEITKVCCVLVRRVECSSTLNLDKYAANYTKNAPYIHIDLFKEKAKFVEVYVSDLGIGIRQSFLLDPDGKDIDTTDLNVLDYVLSRGERSHKKATIRKTSNYGGLFDLARMFRQDGDKLGIKADSNWFYDSEETVRINPAIDHKVYGKLSHGFSIIGYIGWKIGTKELCKEFIPFSDVPEADIHSQTNPMMIKGYRDYYNIRERRFGAFTVALDSTSIRQNRVFILFPEPLMPKREIERINWKIRNKYECLVIFDIPDSEIKKYFNIYSEASVMVKRVVLVSRRLAAAVLVENDAKIRSPYDLPRIEYSAIETQFFVNNNDVKLIPENAVNGLKWLRYWVKTYESELAWKSLSKYSKDAYINGDVKWGEGRNLHGYLDFPQFVAQWVCREICLIQLQRLASQHEHVQFFSLDRQADVLCEEANGLIYKRSSAPPQRIWIGSVYVTGTSQKLLRSSLDNNNVYYFFEYSDESSPGNRPTIKCLLEWGSLEKKLNTWFISDVINGLQRVGRTSFIAKDGAAYFMKNHYNNMNSKFQNSHDKTYLLIQRNKGYHPAILDMRHSVDYEKHDLFAINCESLFSQDSIVSQNNQVYSKESSYDFLLTSIYRTLVNSSSKIHINNAIFSELPTARKNATCEKMYDFVIQEKLEYKPKYGIVVYIDDIQTTRIIHEVKLLFNMELQSRICAIIPMVRGYTSSSLLVSPLVLERLAQQISSLKSKNIKNGRGEEVTVTIFLAVLTSARLRKELKHIMYQLGASFVETLALFDRQRYSMGSHGLSVSNRLYSRLDLPELGSDVSCPICRALTCITNLKAEIGDSELDLRNRIVDIEKNWSKTDAIDTLVEAGVRIKPIVLSTRIMQLIHDYSELYNQPEIEINTNLGLIMFSVENTVMSLTTDFLDECMKIQCSLDQETQMLLVSVHLLLFGEQHLPEAYRSDLCISLSNMLRDNTCVSNITGLAFLAVVTQNPRILNQLWKSSNELDYDSAKPRKISYGIDYLLLKLYIFTSGLVDMHSAATAELTLYTKQDDQLSLLYRWLLYTEPAYHQSHEVAFSDILNREEVSRYKLSKAIKATDFIIEVLDASRLLELLYDPNYEFDRKDQPKLKNVKLLWENIQNLLKETYERSENRSMSCAQIKVQLLDAVRSTREVNEKLFVSASRIKQIRDWIKYCIQVAISMGVNAKIEAEDVFIEFSDTTEKCTSWFYAYRAVTEELTSLIFDMITRGMPMPNIVNQKDSKKYIGGIYVIFGDKNSDHYRHMKIAAYNLTASVMSIEDVRSIKNSKSDRKSMLEIRKLERKLQGLHETIKCFEFFYCQDNFKSMLGDYSEKKLFCATMTLPSVDFGSENRRSL